jgi:hypothetical protein
MRLYAEFIHAGVCGAPQIVQCPWHHWLGTLSVALLRRPPP